MHRHTDEHCGRFMPTCYDDFTDPAHAPLDMAADITGAYSLLSRNIWRKRLARGSSQTQIAANLRMSRHRICRRMNAMRRRLGCATLRRLRGNQTAAEAFYLFAFGHCNETPDVRLVIDRLAELSPVELSVLSAILRFLSENVCITFGSRVRFALENVLRFAGVMPRTRDSSAAYIFETSTISLRLNRCRNCESISRYTCELYENFLALTFSPDAISSIFHPGMCSCTIWAKYDIILFRVALGFLLLIAYPFVCFGRHGLYTTGAAQGNAHCCARPV